MKNKGRKVIMRIFLLFTLVLLWSLALIPQEYPLAIKDGPFKPDWLSLQSQYQTPKWFRDAKFGIWAHWGCQCEPELGDWYARRMYIPETDTYKYHVEHYGHPSQFGFKEVIHKWKAENFDPEKLMDLYKKAGAKYFVAMANHHDNFDNFDSKYQPWNSLAVGPKKDIVGMWKKAAEKEGLRFGVTTHAARTWVWMEPSQNADTEGPYKGVPYDGNLTKAEGKGTWWEGLDPQDLYAQNHPIGAKPNAAYCIKYFKRIRQLIDDYRPDLLYFDDAVLPLYRETGDEEYGLRLAAHYYNSSIEWYGKNEAVITTKWLDEIKRKAMIWDIERGKSKTIAPIPWQTDTCIGHWHYRRSLFEEHGYKTSAQVITMMVDIVSKNGNLLLNIPMRGDGTIDTDEVKILEDLADWMAVNGEAIYGTRPWKVCGEWAEAEEEIETTRFGSVKDIRDSPFTAEDMRFTTKGQTLYVIALAWPGDGILRIKSLAQGKNATTIDSVRLLGHEGNLTFSLNADSLNVKFPEKKPCEHAFTLKITWKE
jgi:alpha-L-fucosidase